MGVYPAEQLVNMSPVEITDLINRDTYENAYESQRQNRWVYAGKNLAEGLDSVLFMCPKCGAEDTIQTDGDTFFCTHCDLKGEYDEYGFLVGEDLPYDNVLDWMRWIEGAFDERVALCPEASPVYEADAVTFYQMDEHYKNHTICIEHLCVRKDGFRIGEYDFTYQQITYMSVLYGDILLFTVDGAYYGLTGADFKAWKCARLWHLSQGDTDDRTKEI